MTIRQILISPDHIYKGRHGKEPGTTPMESVAEVECVAGKGMVGDRYFDFEPDFKGQVTFFSEEVFEELCREFAVFNKPVAVLRRSIIVSGVDLNELIDQEFEIQGVKFSGSCEAAPCYWMNTAFADGAHEALKGRGGLRARVLSNGVIRVESDS
ncbi:MAG: molybdenum cofactor biosysynthesis protein [Verrucomicrobiota bacterium]